MPRMMAFRSTGASYHLLAAEGQDLAGEVGRPVRRGEHLVDVEPQLARLGGSSRPRLTYPMMAVSMLLKSWATPPASWPMASIFCDWRSCSSSAASP